METAVTVVGTMDINTLKVVFWIRQTPDNDYQYLVNNTLYQNELSSMTTSNWIMSSAAM